MAFSVTRAGYAKSDRVGILMGVVLELIENGRNLRWYKGNEIRKWNRLFLGFFG